jgi:DNA invertase Pin-like site-specific DNA recombinase
LNIIAYCYSDPLVESAPDPEIWGWEIDRVYQDLGGRQQLQQLLADCQTTPANYLLVRRLEELGDTIQAICDCRDALESLGVELVTVESTIDRTNFLRLFDALQKYQRSRRIRRGHALNRIHAQPPPGKAPFGYRRGKDRYVLDRNAAPIVKEFFERFLLFGSLREAVRYLEQRYGKKISVTTGRRWLTNPVYRGDLADRLEQTIANTHVAILSREEAAQIDRLLRRNHSLPPRTASAPRSLAGLVVCQTCAASMTVTQVKRSESKPPYLYVRSPACPLQPKCRAIPYEQILAGTIEVICRDLVAAVASLPTPAMEGYKQSMQAEIETKQQILAQLPGLKITGILDSETAELRAYKLKTEISALQTQLAQLPPVNLQETAKTVSIPEFWFDLSETERRFYFREFIRQIAIDRRGDDWTLNVTFIF